MYALLVCAGKDSWRDNPDFAAYLSELSASSVEKLSKSGLMYLPEAKFVLE